MIEQPCLEPRRGARKAPRGDDQKDRAGHHRHDKADDAERDKHPAQAHEDEAHQICRPLVSSGKDRSLPG